MGDRERDDGDDKEPRKRDWTYVVIAAAIASGLGLVWLQHRTTRVDLEDTPGRPDRALLLAGPPALFVIGDHVASRRGGGHAGGAEASGDRLTAIDVATGKEVHHLVTTDRGYSCWVATATRIWCKDTTEGAMHLVAVPSFDAVADASVLVAKAKLGTVAPPEFHFDGAAAVVLLADGRYARIDPDTLAVTTLADIKSLVDDGRGRPDCKLDSYHSLGSGDHLTFTTDSNRRAIVLEPARDASAVGSDAATFLDPHFVAVEDSQLVLVEHVPALDKPDAKLISRVDDQLHVMWTAETNGTCQAAHVVGGTLVIATSIAKQRAVGIDLATGKVLWRFAF